MPVTKLLQYTLEVFGPKLVDMEGTGISLTVLLPRTLPTLPTLMDSRVEEEAEADLLLGGDEPLELQMDDAEMSEHLEDPPENKLVAPLEGQPAQQSAAANSSPQKSVSFSTTNHYRPFAFGDDCLGQEKEIERHQWPEMERAQDVPKLDLSKAAAKAMWQERCPEFLRNRPIDWGSLWWMNVSSRFPVAIVRS